MNKYKITLDKEHSLTGEEVIKEFEGEKAKKDLQKFLEENGYDYNETEVANVIDNGGPYINLDGVEFNIEITPEVIEEKVEEVKQEEEVKEEKTEEVKEEEKEEEQEEKEEEQIEKTAFNDSDLFISEYKGYLVGKKIKFDDGEFAIITDVSAQSSDKGISHDSNRIYIVSNEFTDLILEISENDLQNLIDGNTIGDFHLVLQAEQDQDDEALRLKNELEEKEAQRVKEEQEKLASLLNKKEYHYYIVNEDSGKILSGFEYLEDAKESLNKLTQFGENKFNIFAKKTLAVDANENENWNTDLHDWAIIEEAVKSGVKAKDYSPKEAQRYFDEFKSQGRHLNVVKSQLINSLSKAQKKLLSAFALANPERVVERTEECNRIQNELKRIISQES